MRTQLSLETHSAEEIKRREKYYSKLKHDNYFWCFPPESEGCNIHDVIDFVHNKVKNALEIIEREEMNKSLQLLFKDLNDNLINIFEFGKHFLAYLLYYEKKVGGGLVFSKQFTGNSILNGKLHHLLELTTNVVFETYMKDMDNTYNRIHGSSDDTGNHKYTLVVRGLDSSNNQGYVNRLLSFNPEASKQYLVEIIDPKGYKWIVKKTWIEFETLHSELVAELGQQNSLLRLRALEFPNKRKSFIQIDNNSNTNSRSRANSTVESRPRVNSSDTKPRTNSIGNISDIILSNEDFTILNLNNYCQQLSNAITELSPSAQKILANFIEIKDLIVYKQKLPLRYAEEIPNVFVPVREQFQLFLNQAKPISSTSLSQNNSSTTSISSKPSFLGSLFSKDSKARTSESKMTSDETSQIANYQLSDPAASITKAMKQDYNIDLEFPEKEWELMKNNWSIEFTMKIIDCYALLQRLATIIGWTLELNQFFISMFGNTIAFSKLPLQDIMITIRELIAKFELQCTDLYLYACKHHAECKYKWHSNLHMCEQELDRIKHHFQKCNQIIFNIIHDHLDLGVQMKRLQDLYERFQPFMSRIENNLGVIKQECGLTLPNIPPKVSPVINPKRLLMINDANGSPMLVGSSESNRDTILAESKVELLYDEDQEGSKTDDRRNKLTDEKSMTHCPDQMQQANEDRYGIFSRSNSDIKQSTHISSNPLVAVLNKSQINSENFDSHLASGEIRTEGNSAVCVIS